MSEHGETRLLVAVINDPEKVDEILSGFIELGITGATIVHSEGMGSVLSHDIPIFAGLQTLISGSKPQNRMIFSVVPVERVDPVIALLQEISGNLDAPATGIVFTLPIDRVVGLAPELGNEGGPI
jgi:nitrogen regulatory protein P-II 1